MKPLYLQPQSMEDKTTHYCPGCHHGVIHRLIGEVIDELGIREKTIGIAPIGCAVFIYSYFKIDFVVTPHGRAPAAATGIKRSLPSDRIVFTYQGDGDLASIGLAEIIHAANRGENITTIFVNNANYGMTGGQLAPTTLLGQKTTTSPYGRKIAVDGYPFHIAELMSNFKGVAYSGRFAVYDPKKIISARKAIKIAFMNQIEGKGFSIVEFLSNCPTNWRISVSDSVKFVKENMETEFPLGVFKGGE